jgi:hypothetical protein
MSGFSQLIEAGIPHSIQWLLSFRSLSHFLVVCYYTFRPYVTLAVDVAMLIQVTRYFLCSLGSHCYGIRLGDVTFCSFPGCWLWPDEYINDRSCSMGSDLFLRS